MSDAFSSNDLVILNDLIAEEQQRQADDRLRSLHIFQNVLGAADPSLIDNASANAGDGDPGLVAVAAALGEPLSGYQATDWDVLKGFIRERLFAIRAQKFVGLP